MTYWLSAITAVLLTVALTGSAAEQVLLYTYYEDPPYSIDSSNSETLALAIWLSKRSGGRYQFKALYLPRLRLDAVMQTQCSNAVTAWVNPVFFDYAQGSGFLWSKAFIKDLDLVVSNKNKPVPYTDSNSLNGYRLGGIVGHQYHDFDAGLKAGKITREDVNSFEQNLRKLKLGRIDVTIIQSSALPYFRTIFPDMDNWLYIAPKPKRIIERSLLSCSMNKTIMQFIDSVICDYRPNFMSRSQHNSLICEPAAFP